MAEFEIRAATTEDNEALIALERRSPLIVGESELSFDRAPDYFAGQRLQERSLMAAAEAGGALVGVSASALYRTRLLGQERLLSYTHHMRVAPEFQRHGVGRALGKWLRENWLVAGAKPDRGYAFIDSANSDSLAFASRGEGPGPWPIDGWLQDLPVSDSGTDWSTERVGAADAGAIVALINRTHAGLELFPGYTAASLAARLQRSPRYGWAQWHGLRRGGELVAVAGVYDQGDTVATIMRDRTTGETRQLRGLVVLDYGFSDASAMLDLLVALRGLAAANDRQALEISVPDCSPLFEHVQQQSAHTIRFKFLGGEHPPADYSPRGIYIDPIYL